MIKVLIADDQKLIRESLKIVLDTYQDIQVIDTVGDGKQVLESIEEQEPDVLLYRHSVQQHGQQRHGMHLLQDDHERPSAWRICYAHGEKRAQVRIGDF